MGKRGNFHLGFHRDEITAVLRQSAEALRNRAEFPWNFEPNLWKEEFQSCRIAGISLMGLFPIDCPYSAEPIPAGEEEPRFIPSEGVCQLNETAVNWVLELVEDCGDLEFLALKDQGLESREIRKILRFFLTRIQKFPRLKLIQLAGSFIGREESEEIRGEIAQLAAAGVSVEGVTPFESGRFVGVSCRRNSRSGVLLGADESAVPVAHRVHPYFWNCGITEIEPISDETMEKIVAISPFRFAAKITLQNACTH